MKKEFTLVIVSILLSSLSFAQTTIQPKQIDYSNEGVIYNKELAIDLRIHTNNGFALAANFGQIKTYYKTHYYHFEIGAVRHPKEHRQSFDPSGGFSRTSRSFMFGKQNSLFVLRAGLGRKRYFSEKAKQKGLALGITYEIGPAIGILKPYYLEIINEGNGTGDPFLVSTRYTEETASTFLDVTRIYGASGFTKGFSELSLVPGIQFKASVHFDWGAFDEFVKAMEAGIMGDIFIREMPIMADVEFAENRPYFINLFLTLQLGKRW
ncbi:MAG: hypothetical protein AAGG75_00270 [Bacteroidota bacterium]